MESKAVVFFFVAHLTKKLQDIHKKSFGMICLKVAYGENKKNSRCFFGWYWPGSAKTYVNVRTFKAQFQDCLGWFHCFQDVSFLSLCRYGAWFSFGFPQRLPDSKPLTRKEFGWWPVGSTNISATIQDTIPRHSMGLVYLPTFTIKISLKCR